MLIIKNLLYLSEENFGWKMTIYPMYIYKIVLNYEELSIFDAMFMNEISSNSVDTARIISDWFIYSVSTDKINISAYIWTKYSGFLFKMQDAVANGLLQIFQECLSTQNNIWASIGIIGFEEKLYIIEICLHYFNNEQAKHLVIFLNNLISNEIQFEKEINSKFGLINNYELAHSVTSRLFWISENPLKLSILLINLISMIEKKFMVLEAEWKILIEMYTKLTLLLINSIKDSNDIKLIMLDYWYNKHQVIDLIAINNMWSVLQNAKVDLILDNIWNGPYEYEYLHTDYSLMSRIVSPYLFGKN